MTARRVDGHQEKRLQGKVDDHPDGEKYLVREAGVVEALFRRCE